MSYLQVHFWPGGTEEQYRAMIKVLHPETGLPEGQSSHTSGPTEGGYLISVVWESEGAERRFHAEHAPAGVAGRGWIRSGLLRSASLRSPTTIHSDPHVPVFAFSSTPTPVKVWHALTIPRRLALPPRHGAAIRLGCGLGHRRLLWRRTDRAR